ncbi:MAG: alkaline phosphatase family protein [Actinomycetes bacterium]
MRLLGKGRRRALLAGAAAVALLVLAAAIPAVLRAGVEPGPGPGTGIAKIKHVVIITQENRSFDNYFGTYPGADGIPMQDGKPTACLPDPAKGGCVRPFYSTADINAGGPHSPGDATADINNGAMDGFVAQAEKGIAHCEPAATDCTYKSKATDVMGYHDRNQLPAYWAYADNFVLQDHLFTSAAAGSLQAHLYMVSEWSARCTKPGTRRRASTHCKASARSRNRQTSTQA